VLAVTDPCSVAARVDGVLLVIRISKDGRPRAERAREILLSLGVKILGVVVNAVVEQHDSISAAGYQHYNYGYSYGRYAYEARSSESYYHDEDGKDGADGSSSDAKGQRPGGPRKPSGGILGWFRNLWG